MQVRTYIGLDVGEIRTGIARASSVARLAEPLKVVPTGEVVPELKKIIEDPGVEAVIVGLPRNLNGDDTAQTAWVRQWLQNARPLLPEIPFYWQDEALTTKIAAEQMGKNITEVDSLAASIILQDFLDAGEESEEA
ncbi:MAG: Holliday junction resolvase YqgF [Candidatus Saccharibacteria bacterium]|nr:Holliday junction resolvase YqgF [Candidatus Saccharibacteria bacterium]